MAPIPIDKRADDVAVDVECTSLVHLYPMVDSDVVALRGVDLSVAAGEMMALLGPSGTGKSTLLRILAGLLRPSAGEVLIGGEDIARFGPSELRRYRAVVTGIVLQEPLANVLPYATLEENLLLATRAARHHKRTPPWGAQTVMSVLGISDLAHRKATSMSGGEQRLTALAVGAAAGSRLLLVDEPTGSLDPRERDRVIEAFRALHLECGMTLVIVTHDPAVAAAVPRTVTIRGGRVGAEGRHGTQYAVVGRDGTIQLPPDLLSVLPPDTLVRLVRHPDAVELRRTVEP
jgi:putative ABC transport system ATP-binding protein